MTKYMIIKGDKTSHGGTVLEGNEIFLVDGVPVACKGHLVHCPQCGGDFPIIEGSESNLAAGVGVAIDGMKTACGAVLISSQTAAGIEV